MLGLSEPMEYMEPIHFQNSAEETCLFLLLMSNLEAYHFVINHETHKASLLFQRNNYLDFPMQGLMSV